MVQNERLVFCFYKKEVGKKLIVKIKGCSRQGHYPKRGKGKSF